MNLTILQRLRAVALDGSRKAVSAAWFLLRIMIPTSFAVALLGWSGLLRLIADFMSPLMGLIGLPGEAALAFISGALLNNYSAIGVMGTLSLSIREASIIVIMCLTAHNLIVETAVMKSAGSSALKMFVLRVGTALIGAYLYNLLLPASLSGLVFSTGVAMERAAFLTMLGDWVLATVKLTGKLALFILVIMLVQSGFEEFKIMRFLSRIFAPLMKFLGLPDNVSFLWIIINTVGYSYGAGLIKSEYDSGRLKRQDGDLFNHHAAISHSLLEDTILYSAMGIPIFWLTVPRLVFASAAVWLERLRRSIAKKRIRVGTV